jgi:arginase
MLRGETWKTLTKTIPGYEQFTYDGNFLYSGLRDQSDVQRQRVIDAGMASTLTRSKVSVAASSPKPLPTKILITQSIFKI